MAFRAPAAPPHGSSHLKRIGCGIAIRVSVCGAIEKTSVRLQIAVPLPRIIRLLGYDKLPRQDVKFNRRNIYARDGNKCQYCGKRMPTTELSLDHVVPKSHGGKSTWDNIVCCCVRCNVRKGGRTPEQARLHLIAKPVKPRRSPVINIRLADERYASWKQFLDTAYWTVELK